MNDDDIVKLAAKLAESLVTKDEFKQGLTELKTELKTDIKRVENELKTDIKRVENELKTDIKRVENEVKSVGQTLVTFMDEIDPKVEDHDKRLKKIEAIPSIAHQIK